MFWKIKKIFVKNGKIISFEIINKQIWKVGLLELTDKGHLKKITKPSSSWRIYIHNPHYVNPQTSLLRLK